MNDIDANIQLKRYLLDFENRVIIAGIENGSFGKKNKVPIKDCKLCKTNFGKFVGKELNYNTPVAIDYYGLIKKSKGIFSVIDQYSGIEIKSMIVPVVYFASIKNEDLSTLAPELLENFGSFKKHLIKLRGFGSN